MNTETKVCQNCKNQFTIEPDDFAFYEKMKVPPPTWCSDCRLQRKLAFRNLRSLYKRTCDASGHDETLISMYAPETEAKVYDQKFWWSDSWDPMTSGREYDFSRPFFAQFGELMRAVPWPNLTSTNSINSDYCNSVLDMKNCYLVFAAVNAEGCMYSEQVVESRDSLDVKRAHENELCYETIGCNTCYRTMFAAFSDDCSDCTFIWDCKGCTNCVGCVGLRNKSYYIFNKPYSKEEYAKKIQEFDFGSFRALRAFEEKFSAFALTKPYRYARIYHSVNSTGDYLKNAKNCHHCFEGMGEGVEDSRYVAHPYGHPTRDSHSTFTVGGGERCYESISIRECRDILFSKKIWIGTEIQYSYNCHNCSNLFGCVGLRNKHHCILNKQYSKEEYEELVPKIIAHMNAMPYITVTSDKEQATKKIEYRYGEFFPPELSLFAYNETVNLEYFPVAQEEAEAKGYRWRTRTKKSYPVTKRVEELPDHIREVNDSIVEEVIGCAHQGTCNDECITAFKLTAQELAFYRRMNLPLPRLCHNCRHYTQVKKRNPMRLWHRACQCEGETHNSQQKTYNRYINTAKHSHGDAPCPNEFETSYAPERPEIVYCEQCYQAEVI